MLYGRGEILAVELPEEPDIGTRVRPVGSHGKSYDRTRTVNGWVLTALSLQGDKKAHAITWEYYMSMVKEVEVIQSA